MQNNVNTFNNNSAYRAALQGIPALNQPVYNPMSPVANPIQPVAQQYTPEQIEYFNTYFNREPQEAQNLRESWSNKKLDIANHPLLSRVLNVPKEFFIGDPLQIGTGVVSSIGNYLQAPLANTIQGLKSAGDYLTRTNVEGELLRNQLYNKYGKAVDLLPIGGAYTGYKLGKDLYNTFYGGLPLLHTQNLGELAQDIVKGKGEQAFQKAKELGIQSAKEIEDNPLIWSMILAPNATVSGLGKAGQETLNLAERAGLPVGEISKKAADAIQVVESKFSKENTKIAEAADDITRANERDLEIVFRGLTENTPIPESLNDLKNKVIKFNEEYGGTYDANALLNPREISALQYIQRQTGQTIQDIRREITPQLEMLQEGVTDPRLSFSNRLSNFEHEVNSFRKNNKQKDYLKDSKPINNLTEQELSTLNKHFDNAELESFRATNMTVGEAKKYLGDIAKDAWDVSKVSEAALKNTRYQENMAKLASLAESTGNPTLKHLYDGMRLADEGKIRPYTMAGANIPERGLVSNEGRRFAGKSSSREYGTASYQDIAKAYKNVHQFLDDVAAQRVKDEIGRNMLNNGTIDGAVKLVSDGVNANDIRYINADLVADGRLSEALSTASSILKKGAIPIDKFNLKALEGMLKPTGSPFKSGIMNDIYNLFKETALASGLYLGGNLESGVLGTVLNSGTPQGLVKDIISSIASKGELSKQLGTYRRIRPTDRRYTTGFAKGVSLIGRKLGTGIAPRLDAMMQNMFAEINAHGTLRKMGIEVPNRSSALANMNKIQLAKVIDNVRQSSMMNSKYRVIPRGTARDILSIANPFIDWIDTSMQVSAKMLKDHPVLLGAVSANLFGNIAFDKELQNRLNLKVYTDKPLVTYIADSKAPNGAKEISMNFVPQLTWMEFLENPAKLATGNSGAPVLSAIYEASKGKNPYGRLMRRSADRNQIMSIQGNQRYVTDNNGNIVPVAGGMADEMLSTAVRNLFAPVNLWNRTVAPSLTDVYNAVTGSDLKYYQPYNQSIFGSFTTGQPELGGFSRNILSTGNPAQPRNIQDIVKGLGTYYERDYYPTEQLSGNRLRQIKRTGARQMIREQYSGENR